MLIIDRGSREREARDELEEICRMVREKGGYDYTGYCFLEVEPPFIPDGMKKALEHDLDTLTVVPYFLYPGRKSKAAVTNAIKFQATTETKIVITRAMSMHGTMIDLVDNRIASALGESERDLAKKEIDVLMICHGSKDPNARISIEYVINGLKERYRNVAYCFLEIEKPDIKMGVAACEKMNPAVSVIVFYFLHEGAHVKRDIYEDLNPALASSHMKKVLITKHIGADEKMGDLIIERAREVEGHNPALTSAHMKKILIARGIQGTTR